MTEPVLLILRHTEDENSWSNKQRRIEPEAILLKQAEGRWIDRVHMFICYSYNAARILDVYSE